MKNVNYAKIARSLSTLALLVATFNTYGAERGSVTAIASMSAQVSAFIGYSSGAVVYCNRLGGCSTLKGTPDAAVTAIDTPRGGNSIRAWVGYENGSVYFCTLTGNCIEQQQDKK